MTRCLALCLLLLATPAWANGDGAEMFCAPREDIATRLGAIAGEHPTGRGISSTGWLVEMYRRDDGATWSIVITRPGVPYGCFLAIGEDWRQVIDRGDPL